MKRNKIEELPLYPEDRSSYAPTTTLLMQNFSKLCAYKLQNEGVVVQYFRDDLSDLQRKILDMIGLSEKEFWGEEFGVK